MSRMGRGSPKEPRLMSPRLPSDAPKRQGHTPSRQGCARGYELRGRQRKRPRRRLRPRARRRREASAAATTTTPWSPRHRLLIAASASPRKAAAHAQSVRRQPRASNGGE